MIDGEKEQKSTTNEEHITDAVLFIRFGIDYQN